MSPFRAEYARLIASGKGIYISEIMRVMLKIAYRAHLRHSTTLLHYSVSMETLAELDKLGYKAKIEGSVTHISWEKESK